MPTMRKLHCQTVLRRYGLDIPNYEARQFAGCVGTEYGTQKPVLVLLVHPDAPVVGKIIEDDMSAWQEWGRRPEGQRFVAALTQTKAENLPVHVYYSTWGHDGRVEYLEPFSRGRLVEWDGSRYQIRTT